MYNNFFINELWLLNHKKLNITMLFKVTTNHWYGLLRLSYSMVASINIPKSYYNQNFELSELTQFLCLRESIFHNFPGDMPLEPPSISMLHMLIVLHTVTHYTIKLHFDYVYGPITGS